NELGHPFDYTVEPGTGAKLITIGPNTRACTTQPSCLNDALHPVREEKKDRVDGLGRVIEHWETTSDDGFLYTLNEFSRTTYVDSVSGTTPTSTLIETALDYTQSAWKQDKTELDGHGRPTRKILFAQGSAAADAVKSFAYRNDGTLASVTTPDPTQ